MGANRPGGSTNSVTQWHRWKAQRGLSLLTLMVAISLGPIHPIWSQTSLTRDSLIEEIEATAAHHANINSSMQTQHVIELYAEDGNQFGLSKRAIAKHYEETYIEIQSIQTPNPWRAFKPQVESSIGNKIAPPHQRITDAITRVVRSHPPLPHPKTVSNGGLFDVIH